VTEWGQGIHPI